MHVTHATEWCGYMLLTVMPTRESVSGGDLGAEAILDRTHDSEACSASKRLPLTAGGHQNSRGRDLPACEPKQRRRRSGAVWWLAFPLRWYGLWQSGRKESVASPVESRPAAQQRRKQLASKLLMIGIPRRSLGAFVHIPFRCCSSFGRGRWLHCDDRMRQYARRRMPACCSITPCSVWLDSVMRGRRYCGVAAGQQRLIGWGGAR